jgi:6-phosphogluconolactonase/glucosamine-6-phosphate isomerase/deaminase
MDVNNNAFASILHPPSVAQTRISLTRAALMHAEHRLLHITGNEKEQVLQDALLASCADSSAGSIPGSYSHGMKPIVGLLTDQSSAASVYWSP